MKNNSNQQLAADVGQLLRFVPISDEARALLQTVEARLKYTTKESIQPLENVELVTLTPMFKGLKVDETNLMAVVQHSLEEHFADKLSVFREQNKETRVAKAILDKLMDLTTAEHNKSQLMYMFSGEGVDSIIIQFRADLSDWRVMWFFHDTFTPRGYMVTPGDNYPFRLRLLDDEISITASLFPFWNYDEVYSEIVVSGKDQSVHYKMWVYSLAQEIRYAQSTNPNKE